MDMSGKFTSAGEVAVESSALARALIEAEAANAAGDGRFAVAWRDGAPIVVDLTVPVVLPRRRRVMPETVAIALVLVAAWAVGLSRLL